ncbi:MAG: cobalamin biosynthesis protein CbiG [Planctomycetes bacterium]|nr:cobalamin biosynthesis protein CbiG [Planctomycetota bacterium]
MKTAIITLSQKGLVLAEKLKETMSAADIFVHSDIVADSSIQTFDRVIALTDQIFTCYQGIIYIMPIGVVVRAIAPKTKSKLTDPAVVAIDVAGRFAISLLSGHEGKANDLTLDVANILDADPVISTTTEAEKIHIIGIGCRKNAKSSDIIEAIMQGVQDAKIDIEDVRLLASADIKSNEAGLLEASRKLNIPIRFISSDQIRNTRRDFKCHQFVQKKVNLPAVAEPAALLAGTRTKIVLPRTINNHVTVAIAKESCMWSE